MEKAIFELNFHLRKPYNEAKTLIDAFNRIIDEGGRCEICLSRIANGKGFILQLRMFRCRNTYPAASLGAKIIDNFTKNDLLKISKFNFASTYYSPVHFSLTAENDTTHGPVITVNLFENKDSETQNTINKQFELLDLASR